MCRSRSATRARASSRRSGEGVDVASRRAIASPAPGAGYANHAELVVVPENLTAHVPDGLGLEKAAFATLGAIAMQGLRVGAPVARRGRRRDRSRPDRPARRSSSCSRTAAACYGIDLDPEAHRAGDGAQGMDWGAAPGDDHDPVLATRDRRPRRRLRDRDRRLRQLGADPARRRALPPQGTRRRRRRHRDGPRPAHASTRRSSSSG